MKLIRLDEILDKFEIKPIELAATLGHGTASSVNNLLRDDHDARISTVAEAVRGVNRILEMRNIDIRLDLRDVLGSVLED